MSETAKHSELPWNGENLWRKGAHLPLHPDWPVHTIMAGQGDVAYIANAGLSPEMIAANRDYIVRACNCHEELVEVLSVALRELRWAEDKLEQHGQGSVSNAIDATQLAIAKATE